MHCRMNTGKVEEEALVCTAEVSSEPNIFYKVYSEDREIVLAVALDNEFHIYCIHNILTFLNIYSETEKTKIIIELIIHTVQYRNNCSNRF